MILSKEEQACLDAFRALGHEPILDGRGNPDPMALDLDYTDEDIPHTGFQCRLCLDATCVACHARGHGYISIEPCDGGQQ